ncbi:MAG: aminoacyl-tRNA hydrolase [Candidatus Omnitrophica bacterium]|nr:aminoacyl-tRNA hydrolase [Candidatus Omnitrophota bacterium]
MKLIIGLGNPGLSYEHTRHNLGVRAVKAITKEYKAKLKLDRSLKSRIAKISIVDNEYLLAIPNTFMNLSGRAVDLLLNSKKITPRDLLVIHDDVDLELGVMQFRKKGSSGGHNGISSIIEALNTQEFNRLKLGIGRSFIKEDIKDYVLSNFRREELKIVNSLIEKVVKVCEIWIKFGTDRAMNEFN